MATAAYAMNFSFYSLDPRNVRVLLCGDAADLRRFVDAVSAAVNDDPFILSRIIVAIEDVSKMALDMRN